MRLPGAIVAGTVIGLLFAYTVSAGGLPYKAGSDGDHHSRPKPVVSHPEDPNRPSAYHPIDEDEIYFHPPHIPQSYYPPPHSQEPHYPYPSYPEPHYPYPSNPESHYPYPTHPDQHYPYAAYPDPYYPPPNPNYPEPHYPNPQYPDPHYPNPQYPDPYSQYPEGHRYPYEQYPDQRYPYGHMPYPQYPEPYPIAHYPQPQPPPQMPTHLPHEEAEPGCHWRMVFKAVTGNGRSVYNDYTTPGSINFHNAHSREIDSPLVFRDGNVLDVWDHIIVEKVKVEVFVHGIRGLWLVFNGERTSYTSWFASEHLLASPYHDIKTGGFMFFSAEGYAAEETPFFIARYYDDECINDCGYLAVVDNEEPYCQWQAASDAPVFVYSSMADSCGVFHDPDEVQYGDRFVISVYICGGVIQH